MYKIFWNGEEIDTADSTDEAEYLMREYNLAFNGGVSVKAPRIRTFESGAAKRARGVL